MWEANSATRLEGRKLETKTEKIDLTGNYITGNDTLIRAYKISIYLELLSAGYRSTSLKLNYWHLGNAVLMWYKVII